MVWLFAMALLFWWAGEMQLSVWNESWGFLPVAPIVVLRRKQWWWRIQRAVWGQEAKLGYVVQWEGHGLSAKKTLIPALSPVGGVNSTGEWSPLSHVLFFCKMGHLLCKTIGIKDRKVCKETSTAPGKLLPIWKLFIKQLLGWVGLNCFRPIF